MTEKEKYIKKAFKNYRKNRQAFPELSFVGLKGIDYSRTRVRRDNVHDYERAIINAIDERQEVAKQIALVDTVLWWYLLEGKGTATLIRKNLIEGKSYQTAALDCYLSASTAFERRKKVFQKAELVADTFHLWG